MSEKHVNIKITASTTEFSNAMQKAQKQIDNLAEVIDKLGSSKFGNKLEEQFDGLVKAAKKAEEQVADMVGSLDDLGKIKFDKVGDKLEDISDSIKDINKGKFDKLEQQFKDIVDSGKDVSDKAKDILDLLDKVDKQDLDGLEKEFDQIKDALEKINKETRDSTDTMEKSFRDVADEVDRFIKELNNIEDTKLENLEESIKDLDKYVDEAAESITDFNKKTNELDNKEINDYIDSLKDVGVIGEDVKDSLKKIFGAFDGGNGKLDLDFSSNKDKGGLMSSLTEGLVSGTIAGKTLENVMEGVADSISDVTKQMKNLEDAVDTKSIDDLGEEYKEAESALEKLTEEYDDLIKKQTECEEAVEKSNKAQQEQLKLEHEIAEALSKKNKEIAAVKAEMAGYKKVVDDWDSAIRQNVKDSTELVNVLERQKKAADDASQAESEAYNAMMEQRSAVEKLKKEYYDLADAVKQAHDDGEKDKATSLAEAWDKVGKELEEAKKLYKELEKVHEDAGKKWTDEALKLGSLEKQKDALLQQYYALQDQKKAADQAADAYNNLADNLDRLNKEAKELENALDDAMDEGTIKSLQEQLDRIDLHQIKKQGQEAAEELENIKERMAEINKVAQGHANDFDEQYKAYEKLSQKVKAYLEDEEKGILLREKVAKSFREVANSMEGVYKGSSKLNNADLIDKTLTEAAEHIKELNLVSTENLQADLNRLGEIIEDKTEKIKRFKEINKDFGSDASKQAYGLEKQAQAIRDWANSADFAIEAADTLTHAWGDLSAAGEDHMKIRNRSKYIDDYGKALEENVTHIRNYYHELETLDEIYKECTGEQRAIIDDYKQWEKNKEKLQEYNRAITEYLRTIKDSGGQIDAKFLDELGNFSAQKFIDNFEKMGASSVVLSKQINAVKIELIESIKQYKENAEAAKENAEQSVRNAEAVLEEAKANQKNAESQEEYLEATERVKKAQEELVKAKEKLKNIDSEGLNKLKDQIKEYNRLAEAMREIGMAAQDLGKADIAKFNKSLASMLDNIDTFENDLPKTFADLKEDIKAVFLDMEGFDFSGVLDGLKDIGAGVLSQLPNELKVAAAAAWGLYEALKACAEVGINQFTRGMETIGGALSSIMGVARDVGQEIRDAFENITGMQMDFSSLMEIPIEFESMMAEVGAIAGATGDAFQELEDKARELGATTRYSATEVAEAMKYMGMAGWDNTEIMDGLESVLNLATVANMDLGQASDFVTDGLTALGMEAKDAAYMVDILAKASTSSNTTVAQMQRAFTNCAPVAGTLGINIKDLSMALGLMADKGVKGAKAGTALKNLMANLSAPSEKQLAFIKKFNLEGAQQAIVNGNLLDGIKQMKAALKNLSPQQQNAIITTIAGKEALSGISALLNTTEEDLAELEGALNSCDGAAQEMADDFDNTLKGALKGLASAMQETLLQVFDKTEEGIKNVVKELTEFFHILNGFSDFNGLKGLEGALAFLENTSQGWGKAIADGLENAIGAIDNFLNSESFDNLLQVGTNIINGIADGIKRASDNGSLDSAISTAIRKIATWFADNLDTIIDVGKDIIDAISKGISENGDEIGKVIKSVMELQTTIDVAVTKEKWKLIGENLGAFICEGIGSKVKTFWAGLTGFLTGTAKQGVDVAGPAKNDPNMALLDSDKAKDAYNKGGLFGKWKKTSNKDGKDAAKSFTDGINKQLNAGKVGTDATAASIGKGISDNIVAKLETMDAEGIKALNEEMKALQTTVTSLGTGMSTAFTGIQDSARTAFMNFTNIVRNQMLNCTNIIRNQCINWYNIINNQVTNARNALTRQFLSMAAVARTQMVNISNIIRNQAIAWANIISNQVKNARDALTRQFMSMAAVARTQMNKVASSVKSSMSSISSATSRGISMNVNVNRSASSGYSMPSANALYAANAGATFSLGNNMSAFANNAAYAAPSGNSGASSNNSSTGGGMVIEVPLYLDGKVIARATAKHMDNEIKTMTKRENRKRGAK